MAHTSVYGIFASRQDAEMAIDSMRASGFLAEDISVLFPDNEGTKDIGHEKHTKAPERATAGAAIAGIAGGALGWLAGIGVLAIPGLGAIYRGRSDHGRTWRASVRAASSADSPAHLSAWEFRNTKPNGTKGGSAAAEFCFRCIAATPSW